MHKEPRGGSRAEHQGLLRPGQRRLAWIAFVLLAGYAPVVAWLKPDDTWLMPIAVAGLVGYAIVIDDMLRRRSAATASAEQPDPAPQTATRDRRGDDPGSSLDAPTSGASMSDQVPDR